MAKETPVEVQVRLLLERKGNLAYCSSAQREDVIRAMREWLEREGG